MTTEKHVVTIVINGAKANDQLKGINRNLKNTRKSALGLQASFQRLNTALGVFLGANIIGQLVSSNITLIDQYREIGGRVNLVAKETVGLTQAQADLNDVALSTFTSYEAVASLYARTGLAAKELKLTHDNLISVTETVANTLRLSGASA